MSHVSPVLPVKSPLKIADLKRRLHLSQTQFEQHETFTCNKDCENARRQQSGFYAAMSAAGKEGRSRALLRSNREKPRAKGRHWGKSNT